MRLAVATNHNAGDSSMEKNSKTSRTGLRDHLPLAPRREQHFRWRGNEISRVEGFTDAVFAFAVTLLVVALEVPHTFDGLMDVVRGLPAFLICFTLLMTFWNAHYSYHRRYGLEGAFSRVMTMAIIVLVLFFVYPLKFLFTMVTVGLFGLDMHNAPHIETLAESTRVVPDLWPGVRRSVGVVRRAVSPTRFRCARSCSSMRTKSFLTRQLTRRIPDLRGGLPAVHRARDAHVQRLAAGCHLRRAWARCRGSTAGGTEDR